VNLHQAAVTKIRTCMNQEMYDVM